MIREVTIVGGVETRNPGLEESWVVRLVACAVIEGSIGIQQVACRAFQSHVTQKSPFPCRVCSRCDLRLYLVMLPPTVHILLGLRFVSRLFGNTRLRELISTRPSHISPTLQSPEQRSHIWHMEWQSGRALIDQERNLPCKLLGNLHVFPRGNEMATRSGWAS